MSSRLTGSEFVKFVEFAGITALQASNLVFKLELCLAMLGKTSTILLRDTLREMLRNTLDTFAQGRIVLSLRSTTKLI